MKNWDDTNDEQCPAAEDFDDVRRVADKLGIPYYAVDFEEEYMDRVFSYFLSEYENGRTPNPDVLCNSEIKFRCFLDFCMDTGADLMATGHYARTARADDGSVMLLKGSDPGKDQSYFLCMLSPAQIDRVVFPIGGMLKSDVRALAEKAGLSVARKKDSTGICFIGERRFKEFLKQYIPANKGDIKTLSGETVGVHDGLMYYTLGQRRGLGIGGRDGGNGARWFVVKKDMSENVLYVEQGDDMSLLYSTELITEKANFIRDPFSGQERFRISAKTRYRQPDQAAFAIREDGGRLRLVFDEPQRAVTPGQYAVLYSGSECLGGAVIKSCNAPV